MSYKKALVSIIALVVVTWILISSLSVIPATPSSSGSSGSGVTGTGTGKGTGSGSGSGSLFGFQFPTINLKLPNLNIGATLSSLFSKLHIKLPNLNLTLPNSGAKVNTTQGSSGGGGGGSSGSTTSTTNHVTPLVINPVILEVLILIFVAIAAVMIMRTAFTKRKKGSSGPGEMKGENFEYNSKDQDDGSVPLSLSGKVNDSTLAYRSVPQVTPFVSWNGKGLIRPEIPEDMPLLAREGKNLTVRTTEEMKLFANDGTVLSSNLTNGETSMEIQKGQNEIRGEGKDGNETKTIIGVDPLEDSQHQMVANFGKSILNENRTKTLREMIMESSLSSIVSDRKKLSKAISLYELIYYGRRNINMNDYYEFLRTLRDSLKEPKIFMQ